VQELEPALERRAVRRPGELGPTSANVPAQRSCRRKYWVLKRLLDLVNRRAQPGGWVTVEIVDRDHA
jgi:hypothetical protein